MWHFSGVYRTAIGLLTVGLLVATGWMASAKGPELPPQDVLLNVPHSTRAYAPGERLTYRITWGGVTAGKAVMSVDEGKTAAGVPVFLLTSTTRSSRAISWFFKVRDRIVSQIDRHTGAPYRIDINQRHGKRKRIRTTVFNQRDHTATTFQEARDPVIVDTPPLVQDILSCLYYLRGFDNIVPHQHYTIDVHEGKKNWQLLVRALERERVKTPMGKFNTIPVDAEVRFKGVFFDRGSVRIWLTDDARHIPVLIRIKIRLGHVQIQLKGAELPGNPPIPVS